MITMRRKVNIDEAFRNKIFKAMYVMKGSKLHRDIESTIEKKPKKSQVSEREELIIRVGDKLANVFNIETKLVSKDPSLEENKHLKNKKA
jgi:hypothetical protein